ncbi:MAG: PEP-CTERM sorting domain-containing protein [Gammaproteobacteria bacterium]|nr:PEP-CTERM sorting domain-containing protein [Gammaproteobacteria bacterium]NNF60889.1 PEP-CTERM sorting domain-containing protein [Gammaproteobacteria bacterium]
MKNIVLAFILALPLQLHASTLPFINELHYDNGGTDVGEGVEIAGASGTVLDGWSLLFYNGSTGTIYRTLNLSGTIIDQGTGYGTLAFETGALQNGAPDGIALVDSNGSVQQFLSYEGSFFALEGAAIGLRSTDIGIAESSDTPADWSLQLAGTGNAYEAFTWIATGNTFGQVNAGQSFTVVPVPASLPLLAGGLATLLRRKRCRNA